MPSKVKHKMMEDNVVRDAVGLSDMVVEHAWFIVVRIIHIIVLFEGVRGGKACMDNFLGNYPVPEASRGGNIDLGLIRYRRIQGSEGIQLLSGIIWYWRNQEEGNIVLVLWVEISGTRGL